MPSADPLVLASRSPRRRELLAEAGVAFTVAPADIDESATEALEPAEHAMGLAAAKAAALADGEHTVLGADTVVVLDGEILGKPADAAAARDRLGKLSGRAHEVVTGLALAGPTGGRARGHRTTRVRFRDLEPAEIERSIALGTPFDKAGGYGIQDEQLAPVAAFEGCRANVLGLPLCLLEGLLGELGIGVRLDCPACGHTHAEADPR